MRRTEGSVFHSGSQPRRPQSESSGQIEKLHALQPPVPRKLSARSSHSPHLSPSPSHRSSAAAQRRRGTPSTASRSSPQPAARLPKAFRVPADSHSPLSVRPFSVLAEKIKG